jgi:hypothetical protein
VNSSGCGASIGVAEARLMPRHRAGVPGWVRGVVASQASCKSRASAVFRRITAPPSRFSGTAAITSVIRCPAIVEPRCPAGMTLAHLAILVAAALARRRWGGAIFRSRAIAALCVFQVTHAPRRSAPASSTPEASIAAPTGAPTPGLFGFQRPETTPSSIPTTSRTAPRVNR